MRPAHSDAEVGAGVVGLAGGGLGAAVVGAKQVSVKLAQLYRLPRRRQLPEQHWALALHTAFDGRPSHGEQKVGAGDGYWVHSATGWGAGVGGGVVAIWRDRSMILGVAPFVRMPDTARASSAALVSAGVKPGFRAPINARTPLT